MDNENSISLGEKIELVGFNILDGKQMVVVRKMVGNYVRKFMDKDKEFRKIKLSVKAIHENEADNVSKYEMKAVIDSSKDHFSEASCKNIFICLDDVMKKLENSYGK